MAFIYKTFKTRIAAIDGLTRAFDPASDMIGPPRRLVGSEARRGSIDCNDSDGNEFGAFWDDSDKTWTAWVRPAYPDDEQARSLLDGGWTLEAE